MTRYEEITLNTICQSLPSIAESLKEIAKNTHHISPEPVPNFDTECMDFDEWASLLSDDDRRKVMVLLWNHPYFKKTCTRI